MVARQSRDFLGTVEPVVLSMTVLHEDESLVNATLAYTV